MNALLFLEWLWVLSYGKVYIMYNLFFCIFNQQKLNKVMGNTMQGNCTHVQLIHNASGFSILNN